MTSSAHDFILDIIKTDDAIGAQRGYATSALKMVAPEAAEELAGGSFTLPRMKRFVALHRYSPYWVCPLFGDSPADFAKARSIMPPKGDGEVLFVMWELDDGRYGVLVPVVDGDLRTVLRGGEDGLRVAYTGKASKPSTTVLAAAVGRDPYDAAWVVTQACSDRLKTFRPREQKAVPAFVDYLGWCTWDAFYQDVDAEKVVRGLESFRAGGVVPKLVILDDGWQDVKEHRLLSMRANPRKFPDGLNGLITRCKDEFGVELFGVWHTLMGYWRGIHEEGEIAQAYRLERSGGKGKHPWADEPERHAHLVHRDEVYRFYQDFYAYLRSQGVGMTKVDNQNELAPLSASNDVAVANMRAYQWAMQGASHTHLGGNLLHCMCNNNDVAYHMASSTAWRNSDDYFPKRPESHGFHVHANAMNALWTSTFAVPDWDMFWSAHEAGAFHAAARSISGGPVYVSDKPDGHDFDVLRKLVTSDGRVLRCAQPALPARDCLFTDCHRTPTALKITNHNGGVGVLGLFNCYWDEEAKQGTKLRCTACPSDLREVSGDRFAAYLHNAARLVTVGGGDRIEIDLPPMGFELLTFAPIQNGVAGLGLLDKYNGSAAIDRAEWIGGATYRLCLRDGGRIGLYSARTPRDIVVDGTHTTALHDPHTGLLVVEAPPSGPVQLELTYGPSFE